MPPSEYDNYVKRLSDPKFNGAVIGVLDNLILFNQLTFPKSIIEISKDYFTYHQYGIYFNHETLLNFPVNQVIEAVTSNGLISKWTTDSMNKKYLKKLPANKSPRELQLDQIMGALILFMVGMLGGSLVFALENTSNFIRFVKKVKELISQWKI